MTSNPWDYSATELLSQCCDRYAPVNANPYAAIEAHWMAVGQRMADMLTWLAVTTIILASARTIEGHQAKLDYLAALPDAAWPPTPAPFCGHRDATLDALRRAIGWQMAE